MARGTDKEVLATQAGAEALEGEEVPACLSYKIQFNRRTRITHLRAISKAPNSEDQGDCTTVSPKKATLPRLEDIAVFCFVYLIVCLFYLQK